MKAGRDRQLGCRGAHARDVRRARRPPRVGVGLRPNARQRRALDKTVHHVRFAERHVEIGHERLHQRARKEFWGYAPDENFTNDELIAESYRGIRPAPGYPAQPDHTEKGTLFSVLDAEKNAGISLTESFAMTPTAAVSGLYFAHPESHYFGVGRIERDQVEDYARRKGWDLKTAERWLAPILNYEPER